MSTQPQVPGLFMWDVTAMDLEEIAANAWVSHYVIPPNTLFNIWCDFNLRDPFGSLLNSLGMNYQTKFYAECLGPGTDVESVAPIHALDPTRPGPPHIYQKADTSHQMSIPNPGTYKLACTVTFLASGNPTFITGFIEGPVIQIREM